MAFVTASVLTNKNVCVFFLFSIYLHSYCDAVSGVTAITVLKPYTHNSSQAWFGGFSDESIIPPGLRSRDLKTLPPREIVSPGNFYFMPPLTMSMHAFPFYGTTYYVYAGSRLLN